MKDRKIVYLIFFTVLFSFSSLYIFNSPLGTGKDRTDLIIKPGEGSIVISKRLIRENIIRSEIGFRILLLLKGKNALIKKGIYSVDDSMSVSEIIDLISSGNTKSITITIPEGYHNRQIADVLLKNKLISDKKKFFEVNRDKELLKKYNVSGPTTEGYLFPDSYSIPIGYNIEQIVEVFIRNFKSKTKELESFPDDPEAVHKLIILASIVEREAQLDEERDLIAGVFKNRLDAHYPLESCATIQYLFDVPKTRLFFKDLERRSPYNTYINNGLPPGPISNPGIEAIQAALSPKQTEYKFFVVKNNGSHYFSKTYKEHLRAKKQFLLR